MTIEQFEAEALERLRKHEGFSPLPYRDPLNPNVLTVGYGHNLNESMSPRLADKILLDDWEVAQNELNKVFSFGVLKRLPYCKLFVLVELMFNMGMVNFRSFKRMIAAVQNGDLKEAAKELRDSRYYRQVTARAEELARILEK